MRKEKSVARRNLRKMRRACDKKGGVIVDFLCSPKITLALSSNSLQQKTRYAPPGGSRCFSFHIYTFFGGGGRQRLPKQAPGQRRCRRRSFIASSTRSSTHSSTSSNFTVRTLLPWGSNLGRLGWECVAQLLGCSLSPWNLAGPPQPHGGMMMQPPPGSYHQSYRPPLGMAPPQHFGPPRG